MQEQGKTDLPPDEEFLKILKCNPQLDEDLFEWYWDKYLPKAHPDATNWNTHKRYFGTISKHAPPNEPGKPYISYDTEAFAVLCIMNYRSRWRSIVEEKKTAPKKFIYIKDESKRGRNPNCHYINTVERPEFRGLWSENDSGQAKLGGWTKEGKEKFSELRAIAKEVRDNAANHEALEQRMLKRLREKNGIEGANWEEHLQGSGQSSGRAKPSTKRVKGIFDLDWE